VTLGDPVAGLLAAVSFPAGLTRLTALQVHGQPLCRVKDASSGRPGGLWPALAQAQAQAKQQADSSGPRRSNWFVTQPELKVPTAAGEVLQTRFGRILLLNINAGVRLIVDDLMLSTSNALCAASAFCTVSFCTNE
jgi:hypothetical protein